MPDYASILGGAPDHLIGDVVGLDEVGKGWDAYYRIESEDVFLDRAASSGDSVVDAVGNPNAVRVEVGSGTDVVNTGAGGDTVRTGAGDDRVNAGVGDDTVSGAAGDDTLVGAAGDDSADGGSGRDLLVGEAGADYLAGGSGDDALLGGAGNDYLAGGSGADLLAGGAGHDTLYGGSGGDVFAFDSGFGQDVISDFARGDQISLAKGINGTEIASATDLVKLGMVSGGTNAVGAKFTLISVGQDTIRLENTDSAEFIKQIGSWVRVD